VIARGQGGIRSQLAAGWGGAFASKKTVGRAERPEVSTDGCVGNERGMHQGKTDLKKAAGCGFGRTTSIGGVKGEKEETIES